jgi:hypothetical protein
MSSCLTSLLNVSEIEYCSSMSLEKVEQFVL